MSAINAGYVWPVVVAVIFSAISAYFYLRIVMYMYMKEPINNVGVQNFEPLLSTSPAIGIVLIVAAAALLGIGIFPSSLLELARAAISGF
jgi:NADH-quinone oxidoreductase subunit N